MPIRITGLNSGLDTESIISALVSSYNYKTVKYKKAQTKLSWKQDAWKTLNAKIRSLYDNVGNLRLSKSYNLKKATVSDSTKVSVSAGNATTGSYSVQVTSLAKSGYLTGAQLGDSTTAGTKLSELGYTGDSGKISLTVGGETKDIEVSKDSTIGEVVNQLNDAGVKASYDEKNHRIYVSSKEAGVKNDFALSGGNASGMAALTSLGLNVASTANTEEYKELAQYSTLTADAIKALSAEKTAAQDENLKLKTNSAYYQNAIAYANASAAVNAVGDGRNAQDFELLRNLAARSDLKDTYVDNDGNVYTRDSDSGKYVSHKVLKGGSYDETTDKYTLDGKTYEGGSYIAGTGEYIAKLEKDDVTDLTAASEKLEDLAKDFGLVKDETDDEGKTVENREGLAAFQNNLAIVKTAAEAGEVNGAEQQELLRKANEALANGTVDAFVADSQAVIEQNANKIKNNEAVLAANDRISAGMTDEQVDALVEKAAYAQQIVDGTITPTYSTGATRVNASDATIYVNGAEYTGTSNSFSINGLNITATGITNTVYDPAENNAVSVTVDTDTQGIYDTVKDFLTQYNSLINEITGLYNADSAKGYEPLTSEEKDAMSDTDVELWEEKIKSSILRRDDQLEGIMQAMTSAMSKSVMIDGKAYNLSTFGITTQGYLTAPSNQQNAYHIAGDADDSVSKAETDKLMSAIMNDPENVMEFMQGLTSNLYKAMDDKMKTTSLSSVYTVYNDKEMASEYSDYTTTIKKWEQKLKEQEDYYYKKFSAMETALSKLNSQSSSLASMLGS